MRQILLGDLVSMARAALVLPRADRRQAVRMALEQAHIADKVTKQIGRPHPVWGNGSLQAAVARLPKVAEPFAGDIEYLEAFSDVLAMVIQWKSRCQTLHP